MSIARAHAAGVNDALARFGIKTAQGLLDNVKRMAIGEPGRAFTEGLGTFRPGGLLHWRNVMWPSQFGRFGNWMGRLGTLAMVPMAVGAMRQQDPNEGRLSHALGTMGSLAGTLYGGMAGGMLGMPLGGALGSSLGHGVGHLLGSRP
jgi:hypothetical protein